MRQHAENPVDWWPWGTAALDHARAQNRPLFISIGYAACHWCHVMAHESFEDPDIAERLNESFVSIKVDREEHPDVDALYMAATQLMSGAGGWPMSVFCTPDGQPFMAGTYYPPVDRGGQVGFARLVDAMADAWTNRRSAVLEQAEQLHEAVEREVRFIDRIVPVTRAIDLRDVRSVLRGELTAQVDDVGGFGDAPKFPRPSYVDALVEGGERDRLAARRTLDAMSRLGLYDHIGGGFARYSVDDQWHVPHFEKMLSDQALLVRSYFHCSRRLDANSEWREVGLDALRFVLRDMRVDAGFASSLDADAGDVEGSHVTWTPDEVADALGRHDLTAAVDATLTRWRISSPGEFEGRSIPRLADHEPFSTPPALVGARDALREARSRRVQPGRDEKVILEWNAMLASALLASDVADLEHEGTTLLDSLGTTHFDGRRWWRTQHRVAPATAGDLAWLADAMVDAFELTGDDDWLGRCDDVLRYLIAHHWDGEVPSSARPNVGGGLFTTDSESLTMVVRPKEIFDGATPSNHAVACRALVRYALCSGDETTLSIAQRLVALASRLLESHPVAVVDLVEAAGYALDGVQIVIPGDGGALAEHVRSLAMSRTVLITGRGPSPLLRDRHVGQAYVCRAGVCALPSSTIDHLDAQIEATRR